MAAKPKQNEDEKTAQQTMHLASLTIKNFRSCEDVTIPFRPALTLLVGENNAGKSNVIDALRLATLPLNGRRTRYFEFEDASRGHPDEEIRLIARYEALSKFQRAQYIGALDVASGAATYATCFHLPNEEHRRGRVENLAGGTFGPDSEPEKRDQINHVYLAPLRDAQRELDSGSGSRLALIMEHLVDPDEKQEFLDKARVDLESLSQHVVVTKTNESIQAHLTGLTSGVREQRVGMAFEQPEIHRLAKSLRLKMAEHNVDLGDLTASGLGYANLLYLSTVILELQKAKSSELTLFLVEEPEAHLHPQLQAVLLEYLQEQAERSGDDDSEGPAGRIQVIATTHSPNLASAVGTENIVVLRSTPTTPLAKATPTALTIRQTVAVPLALIPLTPQDRRKIDQYLDVTRSELLFTHRLLLVEGVGEAVMIPALARHCVLAGDGDAEIAARRSLRGTSIISVGSVDFSPYLRLLLTECNGIRLADLVIVITDGDPAIPQDSKEPDDDGMPDGGDDDLSNSHEKDGEVEEIAYNRAADLEALGGELAAGDSLYIAEAKYTLEADLLVPNTKNHETLAKAFLMQHPKSSKKWKSYAESADPARALYVALRGNKKLIAKGQFAHDVAALITAGEPFVSPDYLTTAIKRVAGEQESK